MKTSPCNLHVPVFGSLPRMRWTGSRAFFPSPRCTTDTWRTRFTFLSFMDQLKVEKTIYPKPGVPLTNCQDISFGSIELTALSRDWCCVSSWNVPKFLQLSMSPTFQNVNLVLGVCDSTDCILLIRDGIHFGEPSIQASLVVWWQVRLRT